ncbi:hypothetical protein [Myxococcus landrumensis]|uniref:Lipoprotein n=1 Tax=Myxococcus landrumensis TaxID=2813577 RepID=A0ABX7NJM8_9BACT|nr:hypothetical protein [Myxococcus landrumus]QSQ17755.1 hypothetical protein JY572_17720 [Myxococcus landrumus]
MMARNLTIAFIVAAALSGCSDVEPIPPPPVQPPRTGVLPERQSTVSGVVYDPEAFFVQFVTYSAMGEEPIPPGLFPKSPFLLYSAIPDARVRLAGAGLTPVSSGASSFEGAWLTTGVAMSDSAPYLAEALPPDGPVAFFPEGAFFPLPPAKHYATTSIRPIQVQVNNCRSQAAVMVGSTGALDAVARHLTATGTPTTPDDLVDPAKTGGVVLLWVHPGSLFFDFMYEPMDSVVGETSAGTLLPVDWAPPGEGPPGQSPLGFFVTPGPGGSIGYYALVLPRGQTAPVKVTFKDTFVSTEPPDPQDPYGPRPWPIEPITVQPHPGVSVQRVFAGFTLVPPPPDPLEPPKMPPEDESWRCFPPEHE